MCLWTTVKSKMRQHMPTYDNYKQPDWANSHPWSKLSNPTWQRCVPPTNNVPSVVAWPTLKLYCPWCSTATVLIVRLWVPPSMAIFVLISSPLNVHLPVVMLGFESSQLKVIVSFSRASTFLSGEVISTGDSAELQTVSMQERCGRLDCYCFVQTWIRHSRTVWRIGVAHFSSSGYKCIGYFVFFIWWGTTNVVCRRLINCTVMNAEPTNGKTSPVCQISNVI